MSPGGRVKRPLRADGTFTLIVAGDLVVTRSFLDDLRRTAPDLVELIGAADAVFANLETTLLDLATFPGAPQAQSGGTWLYGPPEAARELMELGVRLLSQANNHALDWGAEGLRRSREHLEAAGLTCAGAGETLTEARRAAVQDSGGWRVGLAAAASTFTPASRACDPVGPVAGRAGVNALRVKGRTRVSASHFALLRTLAEAAGQGGRAGDREVWLFGATYELDESLGDAMAWRYAVDQSDRRGMLEALAATRPHADLLLQSIHSHEPFDASDTPGDFLRDFAAAAIAAGADLVAGHGPHRLRGVELVDERPVFHSLGNLIFQPEGVEAWPFDALDALQLPTTIEASEALKAARRRRPPTSPAEYRSILASLEYRSGSLASVRLTPLDLGAERPFPERGFPRIARGPLAVEILQHVAELSRPFGTRIQIDGDVGWVKLGDAA